MKTRIGKFDIDVKGKARSFFVFKEGAFVFWTAVYRKTVRGKKKVWGRAEIGLSAGDRFDRMNRERKASYIPKEDHPIYEQLWRDMGAGANVAFVRPSTASEVKRWMDGHPTQMKTFKKALVWK